MDIGWLFIASTLLLLTTFYMWISTKDRSSVFNKSNKLYRDGDNT